MNADEHRSTPNPSYPSRRVSIKGLQWPCVMGSRLRGNDGGEIIRGETRCYLIANGFTGEPTAPVIGSAGATNKNS